MDQGIPKVILAKHVFFGEPVEGILERLDEAIEQVGDLVVLALVSTFERFVREHLQGLPRISAPQRDDIDGRMRRRFLDEMEFWRLADEVLPLFSGFVASNIIGQVKQAIDFRNWVAHGRSATRPPKSNVTPQFAYRILTAFLNEAGLI